MACYDCEECSKNIEYGGKCDRFEYNCPFSLVKTFKKKELIEIRNVIKHILEFVEQLKKLDTNCDMEDDLRSIEFQISLLTDKVDEDAEKEWLKINE